MSMFKTLKGFFNGSKSSAENKTTNRSDMEPRVISFGNSQTNNKNEDEDPLTNDFIVDTSNLEEFGTLKELGLKKDEMEEGEVPVLYDTQFVFCKLSDGKYEQTKLIVTNYKICLFVGDNESVFFSLSKIDKLNKYTTNESIYKMLIQLKDGRKFKFRINSESWWKKIFEKIEMFAFIKSKKHFFSYKHFENNRKLEDEFKGWKLYDVITEFERMGIELMPHTEESITNFTSDFKILDNRDGKVCSTYPPLIIVPSRMPYNSLIGCARFRSRERMPALSYAYQYEPGKFASVYRSSQSKVGFSSRSSDDELMLRMIGDPKLDPKSNNISLTIDEITNGINCKIYDARGFYAALGNKIAGKGYESEEYYTNCKLEFLNIPNIHAVREAYLKTLDASFGDDSKFYLALADSKWYEYIYLILYGALDLAKNLSQGMNCLVHCSDGWDRTAQLCSLGAMMLDPFYRTMEGFQILVEKDWIYFGHQFAKRLGQGMNNPMSEEKSQVFLQFLDCVTQIMHQFPSEFEFNYKYIQEISEQAYSNLYGNFLCNSHFEMTKYGIKENTISLWSKTKKHKDIYTNSFYMPTLKNLLNFDANEKNMRFWKEYFLQHIENFKDVYGIYSCKFTEDNLQIIHKHLSQEKILLEEKYKENLNILTNLDNQIKQLELKNNTNENNNFEEPFEPEITDIQSNIPTSVSSINEENGPDELVELNIEKQEPIQEQKETIKETEENEQKTENKNEEKEHENKDESEDKTEDIKTYEKVEE